MVINLAYCFSTLDTKGNLLRILNILCILVPPLRTGSFILNQNSVDNIIFKTQITYLWTSWQNWAQPYSKLLLFIINLVVSY